MADTSLRQLSKRALVFLLLFIVVSGLIGSWIIGTDLLFGAGFWIYGNIGKLVLLLLFFFLLQIRPHVKKIVVMPKHKVDALLLTLVPMWVIIFYLGSMQLLYGEKMLFGWFLLTHFSIWAAGGLTFLGTFGVVTIFKLLKTFKKEVLICLVVLPFLYVGIFEIWKLWPLFSGGVLQAVNFLLSLSFTTTITPPYTLHVARFGIEVAEACSGLDSLFMFSVLYLMLVVSEWKKVNLTKAAGAYLPLAIGLYLVNILRVYLLVLIGVLWSPVVAVKLFHTYAGMVFFIVYFLGFYKYIYGTFKRK